MDDDPEFTPAAYCDFSYNDPARLSEERRVCYELRLAGHEYGEVARIASGRLGWSISRSTAWKRVEQEGLARVQPAEAALRSQELDRLDRYLLAIETKVAVSENPRVVVDAVNAALKIGERRAKLLGLDAPTRADLTVHNQDAEDRELDQMLQAERDRLERERSDS